MNALAIALGAGLCFAVAARLMLVVPRSARIRAALEPSRRAFGPTAVNQGARLRLRAPGGSALANTSVMRALERRIERSGLDISATRFLYLSLGISIGLGLVTAVAALSPVAIIFAMLIGLFAPLGFVAVAARRRMNTFEDQLPEMLDALAGLLKGGQSLQQGLTTLAGDMRPPMGAELAYALREVDLGLSVSDALANMATRVRSDDLDFVVNAIAVHTQVGGSLAGLFEQISGTVRERHQFAQKVRTLTASGRLSAYVLGVLPFVVAGMLSIGNPGYLHPFFHTSAGAVLLVIAFGLMAFGGIVLRRIVSFKA